MGTGTVNITDDDEPALSIADAERREGDSGQASLGFTVTLDPLAMAKVTVDWATSDGTATAGTDYVTRGGSLTFNVGDASKVVSVPVRGDRRDEPDETFRVRLSNASGATIARAVATGTIRDDDDPLALSIADAGLDEGDSGESELAFTVTLDRAATEAVTVDWATSDGTATAGTDYVAGSGNLTLAVGATSTPVTVRVLGDVVDEPDETFRVTLSGASGATIARAAATGTIRDDDDPPIFADGPYEVDTPYRQTTVVDLASYLAPGVDAEGGVLCGRLRRRSGRLLQFGGRFGRRAEPGLERAGPHARFADAGGDGVRSDGDRVGRRGGDADVPLPHRPAAGAAERAGGGPGRPACGRAGAAGAGAAGAR